MPRSGMRTRRDFIFIGRGVGMAVAMEGALKLKEISYIHAEGYAAGELKHGAIALIEEGRPGRRDPDRADALRQDAGERRRGARHGARTRSSSRRRVTSARSGSGQRDLRGAVDEAAADADPRHDPAAAPCLLRREGAWTVARQAAEPREERHGRVRCANRCAHPQTRRDGACRRATIDAGTPVEVLMDRAGRAVRAHSHPGRGRTLRPKALVVCGKGNNGGDGFVVARRLAEEGLGVICMVTFDARKAKGASAHHLALMQQAGVTPRAFEPEVAEKNFDVVVDAIFGTGFSGKPRGVPAKAIKALDGLPNVVAVDIPSGVDGLTANVEDGAIHAVVTVAMAAQKLGTVLLPGPRTRGAWRSPTSVSTCRAGSTATRTLRPIDRVHTSSWSRSGTCRRPLSHGRWEPTSGRPARSRSSPDPTRCVERRSSVLSARSAWEPAMRRWGRARRCNRRLRCRSRSSCAGRSRPWRPG